MVFAEGMLKSVMYIKNIVQFIFWHFLQQEVDKLFQKDKIYPHDTVATQHTLQSGQQPPLANRITRPFPH